MCFRGSYKIVSASEIAFRSGLENLPRQPTEHFSRAIQLGYDTWTRSRLYIAFHKSVRPLV